MGINILDESTASKIAAGEVIERPASVVKELVENALDAGAKRIDIDIKDAGRSLIRVTDDGCGMSREDAVLSLQRHATSKIRSADDLSSITTLGFRGEALPSIASVSHLTLVTRGAEDESGVRLCVVGGEVTEMEDVGAPVGTQVSVARLFYNTPARLKFLKRDATETRQITETVTRFLFSHPDTSFRLRVDGRETLQYGGGDLRAAVAATWGHETARAMQPIEAQADGVSVRGLVTGHAIHRATRSREFLYVNRRWIRHRGMTHALEEAYRGVLPDKRFPSAVILVEVEPHAVDVNVHPTKAEVKLTRDGDIHHLVLGAVRRGVESTGAPVMDRALAPSAPSATLRTAPHSAQQGELSGGWSGMLAAPSVLSPSFQSAAGGNLELRPLAQLRETYILAESRAGLLLVDQHRAQERVLYERLAQAGRSGSGESQTLLSPVVVQLQPQEAQAVAHSSAELTSVGFDIEPFGNDAFLVRAVPVDVKDTDPQALLNDIAEELSGEATISSVDHRREKLLITLCCRSAIKAGDRLSHEEMTHLLRNLSATSRPYTCPHGWPIVMTISNLEIDRKFNR